MAVELITAGRARYRNGEPFRGEVTGADAEELVHAMTWIPNDNVSWDDWKAMGLRLFASLGSAGFGAFDQWSQKSSKYDAEKTVEAWEQIEASPPDRTGAGAIFKRARASGWTPRLVECTPTYPDQGNADIEAARGEIKSLIAAFWERADAYHAQLAGLTELEHEAWRFRSTKTWSQCRRSRRSRSRPGSARPSRRLRTSQQAAERGGLHSGQASPGREE